MLPFYALPAGLKTACLKAGVSTLFTDNEPFRFPGFDFRQWGLSSKENDMLPAKA
jgi:hypothetical protein